MFSLFKQHIFLLTLLLLLLVILITYDEMYNKISFIEKLKYILNFYNNKNDRYYIYLLQVLQKDFFEKKKFLKEFLDKAEYSGFLFLLIKNNILIINN